MARILTPDVIDFAAYERETEAQRKVLPAGEWLQEMIAGLGKPQLKVQSHLPWVKARDLFTFRPGEVTLWAGVNGHGKSMMTSMVALSLLTQGERCCIASFEMKPVRTLERMARQFSQQRPPGELETNAEVIGLFREIFEQMAGLAEDRLWLYDQQGTVATVTILGVMRYAARELKCTHFFVDSLMKCVKGEDDYNGQKDFVDEITAIARDTGMHVHLVHHLRKLGAETQTPDKSDVKGSGSITDQVDNLLLVWRNKAKERDRQTGKKVDDSQPDAKLICEKQRNGEWEGRLNLWFDAESQQYLPSAGTDLLNFAAWPHER